MFNNLSRIGLAALVGFVATIPLANWMIGSVGTFCVPDGRNGSPRHYGAQRRVDGRAGICFARYCAA